MSPTCPNDDPLDQPLNDVYPPSSVDLLFELLSNRARRFALYYLDVQPSRTASLESLTDELVDQLERVEQDVTKQTVSLSLQHTHLPKLDAAEVVEYDSTDETIRYTPPPVFEELLPCARELDSV